MDGMVTGQGLGWWEDQPVVLQWWEDATGLVSPGVWPGKQGVLPSERQASTADWKTRRKEFKGSLKVPRVVLEAGLVSLNVRFTGGCQMVREQISTRTHSRHEARPTDQTSQRTAAHFRCPFPSFLHMSLFWFLPLISLTTLKSTCGEGKSLICSSSTAVMSLPQTEHVDW